MCIKLSSSRGILHKHAQSAESRAKAAIRTKGHAPVVAVADKEDAGLANIPTAEVVVGTDVVEGESEAVDAMADAAHDPMVG